MQLIITRVKLKPDSTAAVVQLFTETNPDLVRDEPDWLGARMLVDQKSDTVTVIASWQNVASYHALNSSEAFQAAMGQFAQYFASPPEITINDVLVDMTPESILME